MRFAAFSAALALSALSALPASSQTWRTATAARQIQGERGLGVEVEYGAGRLKVEPAREGVLYRMDLRYDADHVRPVSAYDRARGTLKLGVADAERRRRRRMGGDGRATIALAPGVPTNLKLEFGAGEADVRLGGLTLHQLEVETGASDTRIAFDAPNRATARLVRLEAGAASLEVVGLGNARAERIEFEGGIGGTTLDFGGSWTRSTTASVRMGVGSLTLRLPRSLGVRIVKDSFLASFDAPGMVKRGDAFYSAGYDQAARKLDLTIDAALGSIDIVWID